MKSKNPKKTKAVKKIIALREQIEELKLDMESFITEHDSYVLPTDKEAAKWLHSLPIESLDDSLRIDRQMPRTKISLQDLHLKNGLKKQYYKTKDKFETILYEYSIAHIENLQQQIKKIK